MFQVILNKAHRDFEFEKYDEAMTFAHAAEAEMYTRQVEVWNDDGELFYEWEYPKHKPSVEELKNAIFALPEAERMECIRTLKEILARD